MYAGHHASMEDCRKEMELAHPEGWFPAPTDIDPPNPRLAVLDQMFVEIRLKDIIAGWQWMGQLYRHQLSVLAASEVLAASVVLPTSVVALIFFN